MTGTRDETRNRIVFTTLLRHELSEALDFKPSGQSNNTKDRLAFLKQQDWSDPHVMDKAVHTYMQWVLSAVNEQRKTENEQSGFICSSWGSPGTHEDGKLKRPQLRIMVDMEGTPEESYVLSYIPESKETEMQPATRSVLEQISNIVHNDLGVRPSAPQPRKIVKPEEMLSVAGDDGVMGRFTSRNLLENEGAVWDMRLPSAEVAASLRDIITGHKEVSQAHVPTWYHER